MLTYSEQRRYELENRAAEVLRSLRPGPQELRAHTLFLGHPPIKVAVVPLDEEMWAYHIKTYRGGMEYECITPQISVAVNFITKFYGFHEPHHPHI